MIDGRASEEVAEDFHFLHHEFAEFFFGDFLHGGGNELEIAFVGDLNGDFVPDVRKQRPGIVIDWGAEDIAVREFYDATAGMIRGEVASANFPQSRVEVAKIDDVAARV